MSAVRAPRRAVQCGLVLLLVVAVSAALIGSSAPAEAARKRARKAAAVVSSEVVATAGAGMALRDGAVLSTLDLAIVARRGRLSGGVRLPLQLQVLHLDSQVERYRGLRQRDWDQRGEWLRLLDHAAWRWRGRDGQRASVVVQPLLGATLGHGSIVQRYHGTLRPDRFKSGARVKLDLGTWGFDAFVDDVTTGRLAAGRAFWRPMGSSGSRRHPIARTFTVGATVAVDRFAPMAADAGASGGRVYDDTGELQADRGRVVIGGLDFGMELLRSPTFSFVPYADFNYAQLGPLSGISAHLGGRFALWPKRTAQLVARYELRAFDGATLPGYFDHMYEVEQARWLGAGVAQTKAQAVGLAPGGAQTAHYFELTGGLRAVHWTAMAQLYDRPDLDVAALWLTSRWSKRGRARVMVSRRRFSGLAQLLDTGHWTAAASIAGEVVKPFDVYATVQRAWHARSGDGGSLQQSTDVVVGLSLSNGL